MMIIAKTRLKKIPKTCKGCPLSYIHERILVPVCGAKMDGDNDA